MLEVFASTGVDQAFESPWGRSFRQGSQVVPPGSCSSVQMHGKVARSRLDQVLRRSGHNRIYATPKTWQHEVSTEYQVIWISPDRESAIQAALNLPAQLGVVMAKGRFGVRVARSAFEASHKALKPSEPLPPQVDVKLTFKVSSRLFAVSGRVNGSLGQPLRPRQASIPLTISLSSLRPMASGSLLLRLSVPEGLRNPLRPGQPTSQLIRGSSPTPGHSTCVERLRSLQFLFPVRSLPLPLKGLRNRKQGLQGWRRTLDS